MTTCLVPVSCLFKIKYHHLQLNKAKNTLMSYLWRMLVPPALGLLVNMFTVTVHFAHAATNGNVHVRYLLHANQFFF